MTNEEINKWLINLKDDIGKMQYQPLWHYAEALDMAIEALFTQPERKKGEWIDESGDIYGAWNYCSVCGEQAIDLFDFCPNCGADMR